jgi:hypothetical protein
MSKPAVKAQGTYFRDPDAHLMETLTPVKGDTA